MAGGARSGIVIRPLTPARADDVETITRGTWGVGCWDLFHRVTNKERAALFGNAGPKDARERKKRAMLRKLARRDHAPLLVAYEDDEPVGFVSLGPRTDYAGVERSTSTPRVDDVPVWAIPCMTVLKSHRGRGIARDLLKAAITYAAEKGAPAIEGYPRRDGERTTDDRAFIGSESLFRRAGFKKIRDVLPKRPHGSAPRVTMRAKCTPPKRTSSRSRTRSRAAS